MLKCRMSSAALVCALAAACGGNSPSGPTPVDAPPSTPPSTQTFTMSGTVRDAATNDPVTSARVQFMTGINAGRIAVADSLGRYSLSELRAGAGLLRAYGPLHAASERTVTIVGDVQADFGVSRLTTSPPPPPYTYTGTVWDSRGTPVGGAAVTMIRDSGANPLGIVTSGADGTFTITIRTSANTVRVSRDGFVQRENPAPYLHTSTATVNVTIARITRYALQPIQPLAVGGNATLLAEVDTDDGLRSVGRAYTATRSSDEAVVSVAGSGVIIARAPGTATITTEYSGMTAILNVTVVP